MKEKRNTGVAQLPWKLPRNTFRIQDVDLFRLYPSDIRSLLDDVLVINIAITYPLQRCCPILVVSAKQGEFELGMDRTGGTRNALQTMLTYGIQNFIFAINKMDDTSVNYSQQRFQHIQEKLKPIFNTKFDVPMIPISSLQDENIDKPPTHMPWYKGPTLKEALNNIHRSPPHFFKPLRFIVQDKYQHRVNNESICVCVGKVAAGIVRKGEQVLIMPGKVTQ